MPNPLGLATHPMQGIPDHVKERCYFDKRCQSAREWCVGYMDFEAGKPVRKGSCANYLEGYECAVRHMRSLERSE